jgi:hypothetical protein
MLIDYYLPDYQFCERHAVEIRAQPADIDAAIDDLDLRRSRSVRVLFALRGMPASALSWKGMERLGFRALGHRRGEERVLGVIGRFWTIRGGLVSFAPVDFKNFNGPGFAKVCWNFSMTPLDRRITRLTTETRIHCTDDASRRRFARYWRLVRPFSGWVRREALLSIRNAAERSSSGRIMAP